MAIPSQLPRFTLEEYFDFEEYANLKHEYVRGDIVLMAGGSPPPSAMRRDVVAMSGASPEHSVRVANLTALLVTALRGRPCRVQSSDGRIRIEAADLNTYPDISVVCGPATLHARDRYAVTNPCLIVEVLSPSTETYDRGAKLAAYQQIPSLVEVVFVAHDEHRVEVVQRAADGRWVTTSARAGESLTLALGPAIRVDEIYFDPTEPR